MNLRATGEGHISSIEFRTGLISPAGDVAVHPVSRFVTVPDIAPNPSYHKRLFIAKLEEMGFKDGHSAAVMSPLNECFVRDDGSAMYYATYTAYNGRAILPQLIETGDFLHFRVLTLNGRAVQNKGMALFPRKVHGQYLMLSRQDDVNLFLMRS